MKRIASRENPHYKALSRLAHSARERRRTGLALLDGVHLALAWEAARGAPRELIASDDGVSRPEIAAYLGARAGIPTTVFADALFAELSPVETPSGLLVVVETPAAPGLLREDRDSVLLDGVQDPGNFGSILRSAAAAGFRQIVASGDCTQAWSPRTLRAGMGAHFSLDIHEGADLHGFVSTYRGCSVVADAHGAADLFAAPLTSPIAWIFGSEGQGVRSELAAAARLRVRIPMPGGSESLNVAAAAAVCLFESVRRAGGASTQ